MGGSTALEQAIAGKLVGHGQALAAKVHLFQQRGMVKSGNRFECQYEQSTPPKVLLVSVNTVPGSKIGNR